MELSAGSHGLPGRGRGSGISAARHWVSHPTGGWNCAAAVVFSRGPLVVVPALGARRDRSGERPYRGRSEERRVGKEGRARGWPSDAKKKEQKSAGEQG